MSLPEAHRELSRWIKKDARGAAEATDEAIRLDASLHMDYFFNYSRAGEFSVYYAPKHDARFHKVNRYEQTGEGYATLVDRETKLIFKGDPETATLFVKREDLKAYWQRVNSVGATFLKLGLPKKWA